MNAAEQQAREMVERIATAMRKSVGLSYVQERWVEEVILRELNLASLLEDKARMKKLAQEIWETRWQSGDERYQELVGMAAEINSENYTAITQAMKEDK